MKLIVFSSPEETAKEYELINLLLEEGVDYFHLRKPELNKEEYEGFLKGIHPKLLKKVMIHSYFDLLKKYNLGGVHLSRQYLQELEEEIKERKFIKELRSKGLCVSRSAHSLDELKTINASYSYIFLSPVFDSISKENYASGFSEEELAKGLKEKKTEVIALGGVDDSKTEKVKALGFDGVAVLGYVWKSYAVDNDKEAAVKRVERIK